MKTRKQNEDQNILEKLAKNHSCVEIRASAIKYVYNNELGLNITLSDTSKFIRRETLKHIENNQILGYIFLNDDFYVASGVVKEINDVPILKILNTKTKVEKNTALRHQRIH